MARPATPEKGAAHAVRVRKPAPHARRSRERRWAKLLRRYWMPALLSSEVAEPDGAPVRVRLLGEDLIAFRDSNGDVGLVDAFCPHRRAPMFFGRNEECGLRCVYHGWKFDRRRNVRRHAVRAARLTFQNQGSHPELSDVGRRRYRLGLHGAGGARTAAARTRIRARRPRRTGSCRAPSRIAIGCRRSKAGWIRRTCRSCTAAIAAT